MYTLLLSYYQYIFSFLLSYCYFCVFDNHVYCLQESIRGEGAPTGLCFAALSRPLSYMVRVVSSSITVVIFFGLSL
jgi:hypothetical protein